MTNWNERFKEIRDKYGYSQSELADILGVDETTVSRYEKGRGAKKLTSNFRLKLKQVFTSDEVEYIEYGDTVVGDNRSIGNVGSKSYVNQGNDQKINDSQLESKEELLLELYRNSDSAGKKQIFKIALEVGEIS